MIPSATSGWASTARPDRAEAEVERERELAAPATRPALELRDRHLRQRAPPFDEPVEEAELRRVRLRLARQGPDQLEVGVRDEELGIGAAQHDDPGSSGARGVHLLELDDERVQVA